MSPSHLKSTFQYDMSKEVESVYTVLLKYAYTVV